MCSAFCCSTGVCRREHLRLANADRCVAHFAAALGVAAASTCAWLMHLYPCSWRRTGTSAWCNGIKRIMVHSSSIASFSAECNDNAQESKIYGVPVEALIVGAERSLAIIDGLTLAPSKDWYAKAMAPFGIEVSQPSSLAKDSDNRNSSSAVSQIIAGISDPSIALRYDARLADAVRREFALYLEPSETAPTPPPAPGAHVRPAASAKGKNHAAVQKTNAKRAPDVVIQGAVTPAQPIVSAKAPKAPKAPAKKEKAAAALQKANMKRAPDVVMLVGMPGSGKSTFGQVLGQCGWQRVSQDDQGKKMAQDLVGSCSKVGKRCVLDRCNVEVEERRTWLSLMRDPAPTRTACVFFDVPADECVRRVFKREGHPTIKAGTPGAEKIVRGFAKRLVPPKKAEGFGHVHIIRTFQQARDLLQRFGVPSNLIMAGAAAPDGRSVPSRAEEASWWCAEDACLGSLKSFASHADLARHMRLAHL